MNKCFSKKRTLLAGVLSLAAFNATAAWTVNGTFCQANSDDGRVIVRVKPSTVGLIEMKPQCNGRGTFGLTGQRVHAQALEVATAHGISLSDHIARAVTAPMLKEHDLILAMEQAQINRISQMAPEVRGKVLLYGKWLGEQEIPDPYGQSRDAFEYVFRLLGEASQEWANRLTVKGLLTCRQKQ